MTETAVPDEIGPEDEKLITLARSSRARTQAVEGAAVRDETGRTYTACTVALPSLKLTALQAAIAAAVSSEAGALEAAAVVTQATEVADADRAAAADMKTPLVVLAAPDGTPTAALRT
ncbi:cytidine deaminase [Streptomonospora sediminis]